MPTFVASGSDFHEIAAADTVQATVCFCRNRPSDRSACDGSRSPNTYRPSKYCKSGHLPDVELVFKADEAGPLDQILKRNSELVYHVCYSTENVEASLKSFEAAQTRFVCVSTPKESVLFPGYSVSFYLIYGFGLIELMER